MARYGMDAAAAAGVPWVSLSEEHRRAIADALKIENPEAEVAALFQIEGHATIYKKHLAAGLNEPDEPRALTEEKLAAVADAASRLSAALADLSPGARDLLANVGIASSRAPEEPAEWEPFIAADGLVGERELVRYAAEAAFLAARAGRATGWLEQPRPRGRPLDRAAHFLVDGLAQLWRANGRDLPRGGADFRSPWGRFVAAVLAAVDPKLNPEHLARDVAERIHDREAFFQRLDKSEKKARSERLSEPVSSVRKP